MDGANEIWWVKNLSKIQKIPVELNRCVVFRQVGSPRVSNLGSGTAGLLRQDIGEEWPKWEKMFWDILSLKDFSGALEL